MKKRIIILLMLISTFAYSQNSDELTAEQILNSSLVFCGGEERISNLESSDLTYVVTEAEGAKAVVNEKRISGKKYVQSILSMEHVPQTTFFDGRKLSRVEGSSIDYYNDLTSIEEVKLKAYNNIVYGYKALQYNLTRLPDKKFNYFDCYVLSATAKNGYTTMNFFDKSNFRLLMVIYPNENKSLMQEYIFKDSILFTSYIVNINANSDEQQILKLQSVDLNATISELWFTCPYTDSVSIPSYITSGSFESTNGPETKFLRTDILQEYSDNYGKIIKKRYLKWFNNDTFGLMDEESVFNNEQAPESLILVRIISWNKKGYVCHWVAGKYGDTQDYRLIP